MKRWEKVVDAKGKVQEHFLRYAKNGVIYYRERFGRLGYPELFQSTGETKLPSARLAAQEMRAHWINAHKKADQYDSRPVRDVIDDIIERHSPKCRASTAKIQARLFGRMKKAFGSYSIDSITARDLERWILAERRKLKLSDLKNYTKYANFLMRWAYNERMVGHLVKVKNPAPHEKYEGRVLTDEEIAALYAVMSDKLRDLFTLAYECMMRYREAASLRWDSVDLDTGLVRLRKEEVKTGSKTGRGREFYLSENALKRLRTRRQLIGASSPYVFPHAWNLDRPMESIETAWIKAKEDAGIRGRLRWHDIRHTALSRALLEENANPIQVSRYAGVSIRVIDEVYLHSRADQTSAVSRALSVEKAKRRTTA